MISFEEIREVALSFPEATEAPHFEKASFRVKGKIFATIDTTAAQLVVKLTEMQQSVWCVWDATACYSVPGKWGKQGWTIVNPEKVDGEFTFDILKTAYCNVAPVKLSATISK